MTARISWFFGTAALVLLASCQALAGDPLAGTEWRPATTGGVEVPEAAGAFLRFEAEGKLAGNGGCNGFFGSYSIAGEQIAIGPLGATRKACEDPVMQVEDRILRALGGSERFVLDGTVLRLFGAGAEPLLHLDRIGKD